MRFIVLSIVFCGVRVFSMCDSDDLDMLCMMCVGAFSVCAIIFSSSLIWLYSAAAVCCMRSASLVERCAWCAVLGFCMWSMMYGMWCMGLKSTSSFCCMSLMLTVFAW